MSELERLAARLERLNPLGVSQKCRNEAKAIAAELRALAGAGGWISVAERLPEQDAWVTALQDDEANPQDAQIARLLHREPRYRAIPAMLHYVEQEGGGHWYAGRCGQNPLTIHNITHWQPLPTPPAVAG